MKLHGNYSKALSPNFLGSPRWKRIFEFRECVSLASRRVNLRTLTPLFAGQCRHEMETAARICANIIFFSAELAGASRDGRLVSHSENKILTCRGQVRVVFSRIGNPNAEYIHTVNRAEWGLECSEVVRQLDRTEITDTNKLPWARGPRRPDFASNREFICLADPDRLCIFHFISERRKHHFFPLSSARLSNRRSLRSTSK